jgi:malate dehydrogenase (oxaloacetate-decarboxylating)
MVYTAFGGIDPNVTLPIMLDVGTNNKALLNDPMYLGWRHERISGKDYDIFINKFVAAVKKLFPQVFLHWEDFGSYNSYNNLANYRYEICSFNDDIQGTGAVAVAVVLAALAANQTQLSEQRIVIFGAGSAGMGVTDSIYKAMINSGIPLEKAKNSFWLVDRFGLLTEYSSNSTKAQSVFLRSQADTSGWRVQNPQNISLLEVIENVHPTILVGSSTVKGAFTQQIVETMARYVEHPLILPLSNPTEKSEATPEDLIKWTKGKALIAAGSPFADVYWNDQKFPINQCNNYFAFPGIGLGVIAVRAKSVSENMLKAASLALSESTTHQPGRLLPTLENLPATSRAIAIAVAKAAVEEGLAQVELQGSIEFLVDRQIWKPHYLPYRLAST